ncbi:MAG: ATP-binding protein [Actinobacteria bacterium]|nr:ATP-binding protein [Actinomycetota bacterium]
MKSFKRFHDLVISDLPGSARLIVLAGPNGTGKSSLFDAFKTWHHMHGGHGAGLSAEYHLKVGEPALDWGQVVQVDFHEPLPSGGDESRKLFYIRSAYRNEADFSVSTFQKMGSALETATVPRLIDNDIAVSSNFQRLVSLTLEGVYSGEWDSATVRDLRDAFIGEVRESMRRIFPDLLLQGIGDPLAAGTFTFEKGASKGFRYMNLSAGEKAAFDLLLDLIIKRKVYDHTVFCIDEPEIHMNTRLQAALLKELVHLIPDGCQMWVASHSIGMMRGARDLYEKNPEEVAFLDFGSRDFDQPAELKPVPIDRKFWSASLDVALADLAQLVAPRQIVLCEGMPNFPLPSTKTEFDARCYRAIFSTEFADTDFLSVGSEEDVRTDRLGISQVIQTLVAGTEVMKVVDRDDRSEEEVERLRTAGIRVLSRRTIESYLLADEALAALCRDFDQLEKQTDVLEVKRKLLEASHATRGNPSDDVKSIAGELYVELKRLLGLTGVGNTKEAFLSDTMARLVTPDTDTYKELRKDIFGS